MIGLVDFLMRLSNDPAFAAAYTADRAGTIRLAGLPDDQAQALLAGDTTALSTAVLRQFRVPPIATYVRDTVINVAGLNFTFPNNMPPQQ